MLLINGTLNGIQLILHNNLTRTKIERTSNNYYQSVLKRVQVNSERKSHKSNNKTKNQINLLLTINYSCNYVIR